MMKNKWVYLVVLALIWGSSYILIKKGLSGLHPLQLGSIRIVFSTLFLLAIGYKSIGRIPASSWKWIGLSALCGTFLPVFLFSFAETEINSSLAAVLNSLVPLFTMGVGVLLFHTRVYRSQLLGVLTGLAGAVMLIWNGAVLNPGQDHRFALLVVVAALLYATNANIVKNKLQEVSAMGIAVGNFLFMVGPALVILSVTDFFDAAFLASEAVKTSLGYVVILSIFGTGLAKILFNRLIQMSTAVFSTSVTYLIPVVGIFWGLLDGEKFSVFQLGAASLILLGVYLVNRSR